MRGQELIRKKRSYERLRRWCWTAFILLTLLFLVTGTLMYWASQGPAPGQRFATRSTSQTLAFIGEDVPVSILLDPARLDAAPIPEGGRSLDILIGLDNSLSMTLVEAGETPLDRIKKVALAFVDATDLERHQIGIVRLDDDAQVVQPLSQNTEVLKNVIQALPEGRSTRVHLGLEAMRREFESVRSRPGALSVAIVLSDGRTNARDARSQAETLMNQGAFVAPIGIGDSVNDDLLQALSSFPSEYRKASAEDELTEIYRRWISNMEQLVALNVRATEFYTQSGLSLVEGSTVPTGVTAADRIEWSIPFLTTKNETLSYTLRAQSLGWYQIDALTGKVSLRPVGGVPTEINIHHKPKVIVGAWWIFLLIPLLLLMCLLPWLLAWWQRWLASRGPALLPPELAPPKPPLLPGFLPPLDLEKLVRPTSPTLVIGFGGAGHWILTYLKKAVLETNYGRLPNTVRFLLFETREREVKGAAAKTVEVGGVELGESEVVLLHEDSSEKDLLLERTRRMAQDPEREPHFKSWWPARQFKDLAVEQTQISKGTNQRRPFGRMALFLDLEKGSEASLFWGAVEDEIRSLKGFGEPTVFLAASLSGGTGGGMFIDAAFLTRRLCEQEKDLKGVVINGLLALHNTFRGVADTLGLTSPNSFAALRELDRFLSCTDLGMPMTYSNLSESPVNGFVNSPLFDNCYLFDAEREPRSLSGERPELGVFPSMADAVHTFLYSAPGSSFDLELKQHRAAGVMEQLEQGHGIVSSAGTFVIRLPVFEFLQTFKYRFAKAMIATRFNASLDEEGSWTATGLTDKEKEAVTDLLRDYLLEEGPERSPNDFLQAVAMNDFEMLIAVLEEDRAYKSVDDYVNIHKANFQRRFGGFLTDLLNIPEQADAFPLGPEKRFGAAVYLVRSFKELLETLDLQWTDVVGRLDRRYASIVQKLVTAYRSVVEQAALLLDEYQAWALEAREKGSLRGGDPDSDDDKELRRPTVDILRQAEEERRAGRKLDTDILVREYLYSQTLESEIYDRHLGAEVREDSLRRLVWEYAEAQGNMGLELKLISSEVHPLDPIAPSCEEAASLLTEVPELLLQDMWDMEITPYLEARHPEPNRLGQHVYERATPLMTFEKHEAPRHTSKLYISLREDNYTEAVLEDLYPRFPQRRQVKQTESLDLHSFSTVTILDSLPLHSLRPYKQAFSNYCALAGDQRAQLHIFGAEQKAVLMEQQLPSVKEKERPFRPRFISFLQHPERLRLLACCIIYGLIPHALSPTKHVHELVLRDKGEEEIYPLYSDPAELELTDGLSLMRVMRTFIEGRSLGAELPFQRIRSAASSAANRPGTASYLKEQEKMIERIRLRGSSEPEVGDLLSYLSLVIRDEQRRLEKEPTAIKGRKS